MSEQIEIKEFTDLLDNEGNLASPGYCKRNLFNYNREKTGIRSLRLKEWNFYQISNGRLMVQLNFYNIGIISAVTAQICNLRTGRVISDVIIEPLTFGRNPMDPNGDLVSEFSYSRFGKSLRFTVNKKTRHITYEGKALGKRFAFDFTMYMFPDHESMVTATPFEKKGRFFYTQKQNSMPTEGMVFWGERKIKLSRADTFTVLDWGRGVWPHSNMWYWANGSTRINDDIFGFELTWGFGNTDAATATGLFFNGKCHKIGSVHIENDPEKDNGWMKPWHIVSDDGRLDLTMTPFLDHETGSIFLGLVGMKSHQVHGLWNGYGILDDGTKIEVKNMYAFCEKVYNKW